MKKSIKTKQQILQAIKQCQKMTLKSEQDCCSKCPYKRKEQCYGALLTDLLLYVEHDAITLVEWLKKHTDGEILNFAGDEVLFSYVDVSKLDEKLDKFIEVEDEKIHQ